MFNGARHFVPDRDLLAQRMVQLGRVGPAPAEDRANAIKRAFQARLANIIRIGEHDVDWIVAARVHMDKNGLLAMQLARKAEQAWMDIVYALSQRTLITKASTWWVNANVQDKPQGPTLFTGGFLK